MSYFSLSFQSAMDDPIERRVSTVGRILPHLEVKIVDEHSRRPRGDDLPYRLRRGCPTGKERSRPCDATEPGRIKESRESARRTDDSRSGAGESDHGSGDREIGRDNAAERLGARDEHLETGKQENMACRASATRVDRPGSERPGRASGSSHTPKRRTGRSIISRRSDDERVQRQRSGSSGRQWPIGEGGKWLRHADESDAHGVVGITVLVRIDSKLDAREKLVCFAVHGHATGRIGLPAGDPNREK